MHSFHWRVICCMLHAIPMFVHTSPRYCFCEPSWGRARDQPHPWLGTATFQAEQRLFASRTSTSDCDSQFTQKSSSLSSKRCVPDS